MQDIVRRALEDLHDDDAAADLVVEALHRLEKVLILAYLLSHVRAAVASGDGHHACSFGRLVGDALVIDALLLGVVEVPRQRLVVPDPAVLRL
eukprot:1568866-Prymnesium_polylepis.1